MSPRTYGHRSLVLQSVQFQGVSPQHHLRDLEGPLSGDLAIADHAGQGNRQAAASGKVGRVSHHIPIQLRRAGCQVGAVQDFLWKPLQPLAENDGQGTGRNQSVLLGEISIYIRLSEQEGSLVRVRTRSAMDQNESRFAQRRIVQHRLQLRGIRSGQVEVSSATGSDVNVNGQPQASCLARNYSEQDVLHLEDLYFAGCAAFRVALVKPTGFVFFWRSEVQRAQVGGFELDRRSSRFLLLLQGWRQNL